MGIVLKQSFLNTLTLFMGFTIGGVNVLFLYTHFLHEDYFGLITFILSSGVILLPLMVFGMQHTVVKFFSSYNLKTERDSFLMTTLIVPLLIIIPLGLIGMGAYDGIASWLSEENPMIEKYTWLIFVVAVFMGYFEVFYAWSKVQLKSVFGNFIKELFARICVSILLFSVFMNWLSNEQFIYAVVLVYGLRMLLMLGYALYVYKPEFRFTLPPNLKEVLRFSMYILVSGSAAGILLEIDKFMIPQIEKIAQVAYYSVGIYIASVVAIPTRAMQQITGPITAKELNAGKIKEVAALYAQTSINLIVIGGGLFLLINLNIGDLYAVIAKPEFTKGVWVVFIISLAKLIELAMGTGNAILVNSKYYRMFFYLSLAMALSVILLNNWMINRMGIKGAALATLIVVAVYSVLKILYILWKFKIQPFTVSTVKIIFIVIIVYIIFNFINFEFNPITNIILKSGMVAVLYGFLVWWWQVSSEVNMLFDKFIGTKRKK